MEKLTKLLIERGGSIVSSAVCSQIEIAISQSNDQMFVDEFGCGWIWRPESHSKTVNVKGFLGRPLYEHEINKFNRECVKVETADERNEADNAHHAYKISVVKEAQTSDEQTQIVYEVVLQFQNGGLKETGANGITDQALLAICLDRLRSFNQGKFSSRENSLAITHIEDALLRMERRSNDRARRGVEGERKQ